VLGGGAVLNFGVLGSVQVTRAGKVLRLGGAKHRTLLTVLLLHANRLIPVERLIDEIWHDGPPASSRNLVQGYVSDLRRLLYGSAGARGDLVTAQPGYQLRIEPEQLDLHRFERLVEDARVAGEPQRAAELLREALALWRGPALADVSPGALRGEAVRLEEARLSALEERVDLDLQLGRHAELIGELTALRVEHPLRERPIGQLMIALHRSGRRAEALALYRKARRTFVEELGL
jgi:DNA-binding SARP family transcriptional activator